MASEDKLFDLLMQNHQSKKQQDRQMQAQAFDFPQNDDMQQDMGDTFSSLMQNQFQGAPSPVHHTSRPGDVANYQPQQPFEESMGYKLGQPIYDAFTQNPAGAATLGVGQGVGEGLASIGNMFRGDDNKFQMLDSGQDVDPELGGYHGGGKLGGNVLLDLILTKGALGSMKGATGLPGLLGRGAAGFGVNYATGEQVPDWLGGRVGAGTLGGLGSILGSSTKGAIGKNIVEAAGKAEAKYGSKIGQAAAQAKKVARPKFSEAVHDIAKGDTKLGAKYGSKGVVNDFLKNPTGETAQKAMSALKKEQRAMLSGTHPKVSTLPEGSQKVYNTIGKAIKDIEKQMEKSMSPAEFKNFKQSLSDYAAKAAPYKQPAIEGARTGTGTPKNIPKAIKGMEKYSKTLPLEEGSEVMNQFQYLMKQHPELYINKFLPGTKGTILGAGAVGAYNYMDDFLNAITGGSHYMGND